LYAWWQHGVPQQGLYMSMYHCANPCLGDVRFTCPGIYC
jgi:hypothetical protein